MSDENPKPATTASPQRWWHWFLLYPSLGVALVGAVPTLVEAFKSHTLGVPFGRSFDANEQNRLWQENFECFKRGEFKTMRTKNNVEIGSLICESGDVVLKGKRPDWIHPQLRWVAWNDVASDERTQKKVLLEIISSANADDLDRLIVAQGPTTVLCQRWVGPGQLLQRIGTPMGCYDQVINTFNGWVIGNRPAPCNAFC